MLSHPYLRRCWTLFVWGLLLSPSQGRALDLVKDGRPLATVVVTSDADQEAGQILVDWVGKMTGATLPIGEKPAAGQPAIYIGAAALGAGLKLDDIASPSQEGLRLRSSQNRLLIAGQFESVRFSRTLRPRINPCTLRSIGTKPIPARCASEGDRTIACFPLTQISPASAVR